MPTKKTMVIIAAAVAGGIALFGVALYATIKTKSTVISKHEPFSEWVGKTVKLNRQTTVFKEAQVLNSKYPYTLLDSLHPDWQYFQERKGVADPDVELIQILPVGTAITLEKAFIYTNGVSGFSTPMLFGTINSEGKTYQVGYQWGKENLGRRFDKIDQSWQFHQAPWQNMQDTLFYMLPAAKWW